jgi:hypothetical protein
MIFTNFSQPPPMNILHEIYAKLETLDTVSSKLDMLPVINDRLLSLENRVQGISRGNRKFGENICQ